MSNKDWDKISKIDQRIRRLFPTEMWRDNETICTIRFFGGFEFFNTRSYHNYETWSEGYEITSGERFGSIKVTAEDLDDAVRLMEIEIALWRDGWKRGIYDENPEIGQEIEVKFENETYRKVYDGGHIFGHWKPIYLQIESEE